MKITCKSDGDNLASTLAVQLCQCRADKPILVAAASNVDTKDEALESAKAYWMMGWAWDEIESILEDSEYDSKIISYALKEAKNYAKKVLNDGPFAIFTSGQAVKLANGYSGILVDTYVDHIAVDLGPETLKVTEDQINLEATKKLHQAYMLRRSATNRMLKVVAERKLIPTDKRTTIPAGPYTTHVAEVPKDAPEGLMGDLGEALATLKALRSISTNMIEGSQELSSEWKAANTDWKPKSPAELSFAQYVAAMLTEEHSLQQEVDTALHSTLFSKFAALYDDLNASKFQIVEPAVSEIQEYLNTEFVLLSHAVEAHLYDLQKRNAKIREYTRHFEVFKPSASIRVNQSNEWVGEAVEWAKHSWEKTKNFVAAWETNLAPSVERGVSVIDQAIRDASVQKIGQRVTAALKQRGF